MQGHDGRWTLHKVQQCSWAWIHVDTLNFTTNGQGKNSSAWKSHWECTSRYYRKRGSASYIVREVHSVRERERYRERERERERRKWRHHCRAKIGDEFWTGMSVNTKMEHRTLAWVLVINERARFFSVYLDSMQDRRVEEGLFHCRRLQYRGVKQEIPQTSLVLKCFKGSVEWSRHERHFCSLLPYFLLPWLQIFQLCLSFWTSSFDMVLFQKFLQEKEKYPKNLPKTP